MRWFIVIWPLFLGHSSFAEMPTETVRELGIAIESTPNSTFVVRKVEPGSPAFKAGLMENDMIISVEKERNSGPVQIAEKTVAEVVSLLKGPKGSSVTLKFLRSPSKDFKTVTLIRNGTSTKQ